MDHIPFQELVRLAEGDKSTAERSGLPSHLSECPRCRADLAWLEKTISLMQTDDSMDAPADSIARAVRRFRPLPAAEKLSFRQRLEALLSFDSRQLTVVPGVRSQSQAARQMLYTAGPYEIDLRLKPAGESLIITGQVLGPEGAGVVEAQSADGVSVRVPITPLGEFQLEPAGAKPYQLHLELEQAEIEIPNLD